MPKSARALHSESRMKKRVAEVSADAEDSDEDAIVCQKYFFASRLHFRVAPVIHMAADASEVGGKSRMMGFVTRPRAAGVWMPPTELGVG